MSMIRNPGQDCWSSTMTRKAASSFRSRERPAVASATARRRAAVPGPQSRRADPAWMRTAIEGRPQNPACTATSGRLSFVMPLRPSTCAVRKISLTSRVLVHGPHVRLPGQTSPSTWLTICAGMPRSIRQQQLHLQTETQAPWTSRRRHQIGVLGPRRITSRGSVPAATSSAGAGVYVDVSHRRPGFRR